MLFLFLLLVRLLTEPFPVLALSNAPLGPGLPTGWKVRAVRGQAAPDIGIRNDGDGPYVRVEGAGRAAWFYREFATPLPETRGSLRWSWRILESPDSADLRDKKTDDSPIRVYVVFGNPGGLFGGSGRVIFYTYGNHEPVEYARPSHASGRLYVIRVDGADQRGAWREHSVEPFSDYRRLWGQTPPAITAIGVMQDTDQTRARAVADLRRLDWVVP